MTPPLRKCGRTTYARWACAPGLTADIFLRCSGTIAKAEHFPAVVELPPRTDIRGHMNRRLRDRPAESGSSHRAADDRVAPASEFDGTGVARFISLNKDFGAEFISALRKFKLLGGARLVYADAPDAGLAQQFCLSRALCLSSQRNTVGVDRVAPGKTSIFGRNSAMCGAPATHFPGEADITATGCPRG